VKASESAPDSLSNEIDDKFSAATYLQSDELAPWGKGLVKHGYQWHISDRTHKVALRGTVKAVYEIDGKIVANDADPVPHEYAVKVRGFTLPESGITPAAATAAINKANEQYAQVGIILVPFCDAKKVANLDLTNGFAGYPRYNPGEKLKLTADETKLFAHRTGVTDEIELFFINKFTDGAAGRAYTVMDVPDVKYADIAVIAADQMANVPFVIPHEIGHVLLGHGDHDVVGDPDMWVNLMFPEPRPDTTYGPKRLTPGQKMLCGV